MDAITQLTGYVKRSLVPLTLADASQPDIPLIAANTGFSEMTGYAEEEIIGRNCRFLQGKVPQPDARAEVTLALKNAQQTQITLHNFKKNGEPFTNLLFLYPLDAPNDRLLFLGSQLEIHGEAQDQLVGRRVHYLAQHLEHLRAERSALRIKMHRTSSDAVAMALTSLHKATVARQTFSANE